MADKNRYPQIPSTVWWGLRSILNRTPNATIDERLLGVQLSVQEAAARAYISELRSVGILTEEGKATPLAQRWRLDESYAGAVTDLIKASYPEGLVDVAPPGDAERQKVVSWFQREGLGQGAAGNKAATYLLLSSPTPNEAPKAASKSSQGENSTPARPVRRRANSSSPMNDATKPQVPREEARDSKSPPQGRSGEAFPLNVIPGAAASDSWGIEQNRYAVVISG